MVGNFEKELLKEIKNLQNEEYVKGLDSSLGPEYDAMIKGTLGNEIVDTGMAMLDYVFDLIKKDFNKGMDALKVTFVGYPGLPHTDLYAPYYDSITTRRLWYRATEELDMNNHLNSSLMLNTFFRWYTSTYELFRKMLIFDCYCHGLSTGHPINIRKYLFHSQEPSKLLNSSSKQGKTLLKYYDATIRHSISHGNILIIPDYFVVIRQTDREKENVIENRYNKPDDFISEVTPNIEVMYGAVRFFNYILVNYLFVRYSDEFAKYIGNLFTDGVLVAMVKSIQANTMNPVY